MNAIVDLLRPWAEANAAEHLELTGEFGLRQAPGSAVAWAEGDGR